MLEIEWRIRSTRYDYPSSHGVSGSHRPPKWRGVQLVVGKNETCKLACNKQYNPDQIELFLQMAVEQYRVNMYPGPAHTEP